MTTLVWDDSIKDFAEALDADDATSLRQHASGVFAWLDTQSAQDNPDGDQRDALFDHMMQVVPHTDRAVWSLTTALVGYVSRTEEQVGQLADALFVLVQTHAGASLGFATKVHEAFEDYDPDETERTEESILGALMQDEPEAGHAWRCVSRSLDNLIVLMSYERTFLRRFRDDGQLKALVEPLAPVHSQAKQMLGLLAVLDDATIVALDTSSSRGFVLHADGVTDLPQLHALLIDVLAEHYPHDPLEEDARGIVDGTGAGFTGAWTQGVWSFWRPDALVDGQVPDSLNTPRDVDHLPTRGGVDQLPRQVLSSLHISVDGVAADQEAVVLLMGPSAHFESWTLQRLFLALRAQISIVRPLSDEEYHEALNALVQ